MMLAKTAAASIPKSSTGRQVTSTERSVVVAISMKLKRRRKSRYWGRAGPAWRPTAARKRATPEFTAGEPGLRRP
jgi:hypothetical protein